MSGVPTSVIARSLSRRAALRLTAGALLTSVGLAGAVSCSSESDEEADVDTLVQHLSLARRDADAAAALTAVAPELVDALTVVRAERSAHADALAAEIDRLAGGTQTSTQQPPATTSPSTAPAPPPTVGEVMAYLTESQRAAADAARNESGYRAGLLASISAALAVEVSVVLV